MIDELSPQCRTAGTLLLRLAEDQSKWSQETFGDDSARGPVGALKHLEREAREAIDKPDDPSEYADCFLLILDAARRAGMSPLDLIRAASIKMKVNRSREWPKPVNDEPVEHYRGIDGPVT